MNTQAEFNQLLKDFSAVAKNYFKNVKDEDENMDKEARRQALLSHLKQACKGFLVEGTKHIVCRGKDCGDYCCPDGVPTLNLD